MFSEHLQRLREAVNDTYTISNLAPWITKHTWLDGRRYSFKDHEFQLDILACTAQTSIIVKCAQIGMSELAYRQAVAACCTQDDFTTIYTFPASADAEKNCKTRIDPMIAGSPELARLVSKDLNNSEVKQFGANSFLFFKGTFSSTQALSTPANMVIHDEWDKSDTTQGSVYVSRLQHKPHKLRKIFSTPTIEKYGVSKEAETANRLKHLATCARCNHVFLPDYFNDIKVPGWDKPLEEITKNNIHTIRWREATLLCPKCGKDPQLHHTRMQFVAENPSEKHEANAWYISPFSAHNILLPSYLVEVSTKYEKYSEFKNQTLGLTAEEKNESISVTDILEAHQAFPLDSSEMHMMGCDMGIICHITIGRLATTGELLVVHRERVHYTHFEEKTLKLAQQYRVMVTVMDSQPYTDLVTRICQARQGAWGAVFIHSKNPTMFVTKERAEDAEEGKMAMRLVNINRTTALDALLNVIKDGSLVVAKCDDINEFAAQMTSLKRVQKFTKDGELTYFWEKTDGNDHYHFSTLYMFMAVQLRGTIKPRVMMGSSIPLVKTFKSRL